MKYMLLVYRDEAAFEAPAPAAGHSAPFIAYSREMDDAAIRLDGNRLLPSAGTATVRVRDGKAEVLGGPYSDTNEQLGGYYLIDVPDLESALEWAARCPAAAQGAVEVRGVFEA
jgi:hypothetical protein